MLKIIKERTPETIIDYYLEFTYKDDPNTGFMFPANPDGTPAFDKMSKRAKANYESCLGDDAVLIVTNAGYYRTCKAKTMYYCTSPYQDLWSRSFIQRNIHT